MGHIRTVKVQINRMLPPKVSSSNNNRIRHYKLDKFQQDRRMDTQITKVIN